MAHALQLTQTEYVDTRPFTDPGNIAADQHTLQYMARQVCLLLEHPYLSADPPHTTLFTRQQDSSWFHRIVLAQPEQLRKHQKWAIVGFFGQKRENADMDLAHEFDRTLVAEIPQHQGLLSYSTMALSGDNYANFVVFKNNAARDHWSTSNAHDKAVRQLAPSYYKTVHIYNGWLPDGVRGHESLYMIRAKYYDYQSMPRWQAVRDIAN